MLEKCHRPLTKEQVLHTEQKILEVLEFDIAIDSTPYSYLYLILGDIYADKLE